MNDAPKKLPSVSTQVVEDSQFTPRTCEGWRSAPALPKARIICVHEKNIDECGVLSESYLFNVRTTVKAGHQTPPLTVRNVQFWAL